MPTVRERDGRFQAIVRLKKEGQLIYHEARTFSTERLARDWGQRLERALAVQGLADYRASKTTLHDLIDKYEAARDQAGRMRRAMRHELAQLQGDLGHHSLDSLKSETLVAFARERRKAGAGPVTVMHNLATLRSILNAAKPMFGIHLETNAAASAIDALTRIGLVGRSTHRDRRITRAELDLLIAEFTRIAPHPGTVIPMATIVSLAIELPRRLGELCRMRWEDYQGKTIILRGTKNPKAPRTEQVPVPPQARAIIDALPVIDERVLPYHSESVSAAFQRACRRVGILDLHFHDLRHEGISRLFERGLSIQEVALISGHESWTMLKRYTHLKPEDVVEKLSVGQ